MKKRNPIIFILTLLLTSIVFLTGCDNGRHYWTNDVENHDTLNKFDVFLEKDETYEIDFYKQFKASGINITKVTAESSNTDVFTVKGNKIIATGMGQARLGVEIYSKENNTYYYTTSAYVYVTDQSDANLIEIKTAQDLANISLNATGKYILKNDIDLSNWGDWEPIGNVSATGTIRNAFFGMFINPNGYKIKNLTIRSAESISDGLFGGNRGGLFGWLENAYIDGIILENIFINLTDFEGGIGSTAGGIVSSYSSSVIRNCSVDGTIIAQNMVGGIVGGGSWGRIIGCSFNGTVKATEETAAGIASYGYIVKNCHAEGIIEGAFASGGIMGCAPAGYYIQDCSFTGELLGDGYKNENIAYPTSNFVSS